jgi:hypothetical protein
MDLKIIVDSLDEQEKVELLRLIINNSTVAVYDAESEKAEQLRPNQVALVASVNSTKFRKYKYINRGTILIATYLV